MDKKELSQDLENELRKIQDELRCSDEDMKSFVEILDLANDND